jgi:general secretion pathway protein K
MHRRHNQQLTHQSGSAIVAVLLVVAVISIIAIGLMVQQRIDIRRTQQLQTANQAYRYAQGVLYWAIGTIKIAQTSTETPDTELWQRDLPATLVANQRGQTTGHLERLDQRLNLNALTDASKQDDAVKFLVKNIPELSETDAKQIVKNISEWVGTAPSASDSYYSSQNPPYRAAHIPMLSPSEMRLVVGIDAGVYQKLIPQIITLPSNELQKNSMYYLLETDVLLDDQHMQVYSILQQVGAPPNVSVNVLWSTQGAW